MKLIARSFLFIFIIFLAAPTVVTLIEKSCDTRIFYSISEEEHGKKEIKVYASNSDLEVGLLVRKFLNSSLILSENLSKHNNVAGNIFSPPPNLA